MLASKRAIIQVSLKRVNTKMFLGACSNEFRKFPGLGYEFFSKIPRGQFLENSYILIKSFYRKMSESGLNKL